MRSLLAGLLSIGLVALPLQANGVNDNRVTKWDQSTDSTVPGNYDIQYVQYQEYQKEPDTHHFNAYMAAALSAGQFNNSDGSWVGLIIDADLDGEADYQIEFEGRDLATGLLRPFDVYKKTRDRWAFAPSCKGGVYMTNAMGDLTSANRFLSFEVDHSCLELPKRFSWFFFIDANGADKANGIEIGPDDWFQVNHTLSTISRSLTGIPKVNKLELFKNPNPTDVSSLDPQGELGEKLLQGTAEIRCKSRLRHAWVPNAILPANLAKAGYKSMLVTTFAGVQSCMEDRVVVVTTYDGRVVEGLVINWDAESNLALVAVTPALKKLRFQGEWPTAGWAGGVYTSIRSSEPSLSQAVITAVSASDMRLGKGVGGQEIDGLPVFDSQGGVLGTVVWDPSVTQSVTRVMPAPVLCQKLLSCNSGLVWSDRLTKYFGEQTLKLKSASFKESSASLDGRGLGQITSAFKGKELSSLTCTGFFSSSTPSGKALADKRARFLCSKVSAVTGKVSYRIKSQVTKTASDFDKVLVEGIYLPNY